MHPTNLSSLRLHQWLGRELNPRHADFQSAALPPELPSLEGRKYKDGFASDLPGRPSITHVASHRFSTGLGCPWACRPRTGTDEPLAPFWTRRERPSASPNDDAERGPGIQSN